MIDSIHYDSLKSVARLIRSREISPLELTEYMLARIESVDQQLLSYATVTADHAMDAARKAEREINGGQYRGPLHGIPIAVKDLCYTRGIRTMGGLEVLRDFVPTYDATVVTRLEAAGAVLLGKLNLTEGALSGYNPNFDIPVNPWGSELWAGVSSSGSAVATAAGLCFASLGTDTGGSIRGPAAFCGLAGIRPSWGRVSRYGVLGASWSMDTVGPISRTVADCAMTLGAIAGYDPRDPYTWDAPVPDYLAKLDGEIRGIKVGVVRERMQPDGVESEVLQSVEKAIAALGELGAMAEEVSIPLIAASAAISATLIMVDAAVVHRKGIEEYLDQYDHNNQIRLLFGSILPAQAHQKATRLREVMRRQILDALERVDVLVMPTSSIPASPIPAQSGMGAKQEVLRGFAGRRSFTNPFNLANVPALSVNCGFTSQDLPVGLQVIGKPFQEELLFRVAHAYEQATDWHTRRPPI